MGVVQYSSTSNIIYTIFFISYHVSVYASYSIELDKTFNITLPLKQPTQAQTPELTPLPYDTYLLSLSESSGDTP